MNSHIENAICVTTYDPIQDAPSPASLSCRRYVMQNGAVTFNPLVYGDETLNQESYREEYHDGVDEYNAVGQYGVDARKVFLDEIELVNLSYLNAAAPVGNELHTNANLDKKANYDVHRTLNFRYTLSTNFQKILSSGRRA